METETTQPTTNPLGVRPATIDDLRFIKSSWANSFRTSAFAAGVEVDDAGNMVSSAVRTMSGGKIRDTDIPASSNRRRLSVGMRDVTYFYELPKVIELLAKSGAKFDVMVQDDGDIAAWLCHDEQDGIKLVHYIYVKLNQRGQGCATALLSYAGIYRDQPVFFTSAPPPVFNGSGRCVSNWKDVWLRKTNWIYNPYLMLFAVAA